MQAERLKILLDYLAEDPNDPFNLYAVAMEYISKDAEKALSYLKKLLAEHPDYIPTYYHAAALYFELGENELAEQTYILGIEKAHQKQNLKAFDELKRAYRMFLDEVEE
jgi:Tfp pilus assembly protein PilF